MENFCRRFLRTGFFLLVLASAAAACGGSPRVQRVILMIGDGMGPQQVSLAAYNRRMMTPGAPELNLEKLYREGVAGVAATFSSQNVVTDSAAAATAMACGIKTRNGMIGSGPDGEVCDSLLRKVARQGKSTGLVSTTRLSHATPAAFASYSVSREDENGIAEQMLSEGLVDVLLNGGGRHLIPQGTQFSQLPECAGLDPRVDGQSKRSDDRNLITEAVQKRGYGFVCTSEQMRDFRAGEGQKLLGIFANSSFPHATERLDSKTVPTLAEMTVKALAALESDPDGFFLMVEGGQIDYAAHENDAGEVIREIADFDAAIGVALKFIASHPDTLLVVTADHETGGLGVVYHQYVKGDVPERVQLKNGQTYVSTNAVADPQIVFGSLARQNSSYTALLNPFLDQIYVDGVAPETLADKFAQSVLASTGYALSHQEIAFVLKKEALFAAKIDSPFLLSSAGSASELHANKLAKVLFRRNFVMWATGTHTAVAVPVLVKGPHAIEQKFRGFLDNTDIFRLLSESLLTPQ